MSTPEAPPLARAAPSPHLTADEERALAARIAGGDMAARDELVERNTPLAQGLANGYRNRGLDDDDLLQWAKVGLIEAAARFDPGRGRFTTIAHPYILKHLRAECVNTGTLIRVPLDVYQDHLRALKGAPLGPFAAERARLARLSLAVRAVGTAGDGGPDVDDLPDGRAGVAEGPADGAGADPDAMLLLLAALPGREAEVIRRRFGLGGGPSESRQEIGLSFGCSQEVVYNMEYRALGRLRAAAGPGGARAPMGPEGGGV